MYLRSKKPLAAVALGACLVVAATEGTSFAGEALHAHGHSAEPSAVAQEPGKNITALPDDAGEVPTARYEAARTGKRAELISERTETSRTFANPDGTFTTEMTSGPERIKRAGKWHTVDTTLRRNSDGSVSPKAHPADLKLAGKSGTPTRSLKAAQADTPRMLARMDGGAGLDWKGGLPEPKLDGDTATYENAVPGADLIIKATRTGFEQFLRLNKRPDGEGPTPFLSLPRASPPGTTRTDPSPSSTTAASGAPTCPPPSCGTPRPTRSPVSTPIPAP